MTQWIVRLRHGLGSAAAFVALFIHGTHNAGGGVVNSIMSGSGNIPIIELLYVNSDRITFI